MTRTYEHDRNTPKGIQVSELAAQMRAEIRLLRKGRGVHAGDLDQRLGQHLLTLTAGQHDSPSRRSALTAVIDASCLELPDDLRTAIRAGLGMCGETARMRLFKDRVAWLAGHLHRNDRTALRRIELAEQLLAERLAAEVRRRQGAAAVAPDGWYVSELRTVLRLDTPRPESHEFRRIVALQDGLRHTMAWLDLPRGPDEPRAGLGVEVLYGGRLVRREVPSHTRLQFVLELPKALDIGEEHDFALILRVRPGETMRPHYIVTPECRMDFLELRVRFDQDNLPRWVRRVRGETVRMFESARPADELEPDEAGEVLLRFEKLSRYLGYGAQWGY
jgi:hypothetical protein